jgi:hypothetical protein
MIPAVVLAATTDPRLRWRTDLVVLLWLHVHLDNEIYRPLKQHVLARQSGVPQPTVCKALKRLVGCGYVVKRPEEGDRRALEYRLTCPPSTVAAGLFISVVEMAKRKSRGLALRS